MKTIHIRSIDPTKKKKLMMVIYKKFLVNDNLFHHFYYGNDYSSEIVIRVGDDKIGEAIKEYLNSEGRTFEEYAYPYVKEGTKWKRTKGKRYCFECKKFIRDNLDLFLPIYHANSVFALSKSDKVWREYLRKITHTIYNSRGFNYGEETKDIIKEALLSAYYSGG